MGGFVIEGVLGSGPHGVVYEATQAGLDRRVALKVFRPGAGRDDRLLGARWPEHPNVASLYAAGAGEHGFFTATQLVAGPALADLDRWAAGAACDDVARALEAAHAAGFAHGAVSAGNVLVDGGRALLTDFTGATGADAVAADLAAFAALRASVGAAPGGRRARGRALVALGVAAAAVAATLAVLTLGHDEHAAGPPPSPAGARPLGSPLAAGPVRSVDCDGHAAIGASPGCTLMQTRDPGALLVVPADGAIKGWVLRGASGELRLHVLRARGGRFEAAASSQIESVRGAGFVRLPADVAVRRGDRVGVELLPGAAIGTGPQRPDVSTARFSERIRGRPKRPDGDHPAGLAAPLLVRVDYVPGARATRPPLLTGTAAARAPAGRALTRGQTEAGGRRRSLAVVALPTGIALDLFAGPRRLARVAVPDADPRGRLQRLEIASFAYPNLVWRNPDGRFVEHGYDVTPSSLVPRE